MITCYDIIRSLLRTERGAQLETKRQYIFQVAPKATKVDIKHAIEEIYKVKVQAVNTSIVSAKPKRVRQELGRTSPWKKAIVTLQEGQKIEVS